MKNMFSLGLASLFLVFAIIFAPQQDQQDLDDSTFYAVLTSQQMGQPFYVQLCKDIIESGIRDDLDNVGDCISLFTICGKQGSSPVCICKILDNNDLLPILGFNNYGDCVSTLSSNQGG